MDAMIEKSMLPTPSGVESATVALDLYFSTAEPVLAQALSRLDAEVGSVSRGSFDRTWWNWKFSDFSASRFQEGVFTLAWLAFSPDAPEKFRGRARLISGLEAALEFWCGLQHSDGSFDEAYPYERSLAATAFTGFYVGSALELAATQIAPKVRERALDSLQQACEWLSRHEEDHGVLSNHKAAAAAALQVGAELLEAPKFADAARRVVASIARHQHAEGWLREYGGADPGYQTHAIFYLSEVWRRSHDAELLAMLERACDFSEWFMNPDGTMGGEHCSRGTKFVMPAGFETLAPVCASARKIALFLRIRMERGHTEGPNVMDAWNTFPVLNNALFAATRAGDIDLTEDLSLPWQRDGAVGVFSGAGLAVARGGDLVVATGPARGGSTKLWHAESGRLLYEDCGYVAEDERGRSMSSQFGVEWRIDESGPANLEVTSTACFRELPRARFSTPLFLAFRVFTTTIGRVPGLARWVKRRLVRSLVDEKQPDPARLERVVRFDANGALTIDDRLSVVPNSTRAVARNVPLHMGSARYASLDDQLGAEISVSPPTFDGEESATRTVRIEPGRTGASVDDGASEPRKDDPSSRRFGTGPDLLPVDAPGDRVARSPHEAGPADGSADDPVAKPATSEVRPEDPAPRFLGIAPLLGIAVFAAATYYALTIRNPDRSPAFEEAKWGFAVVGAALVAFAGFALWMPARYAALFRRLRALEVGPTIVVSVITLALTNVFDAPLLRRFVFSACLVALAPAVWTGIVGRIPNALPRERLTRGFVGMILIVLFIPGAFLPPFTRGIPGWAFPGPSATAPIHVNGFQLVRDDGARVWLSRGVVSPITFTDTIQWGEALRRDTAATPEGEEELVRTHREDLLRFYFAIYEDRYGDLSRGVLSNQKWLGKYGYPGHNPYRAVDYSEFPPHRIVRIEKAGEVFHRDSYEKFAESTIFAVELSNTPNAADGKTR